MKKQKQMDVNAITLIVLIVIVVVIEALGDYCNRHSEELRQKSWKRFEERNIEMMHMVNWNNAYK